MRNFFHGYGQAESRHMVVLYDKSTGEIQHIHEEIFLQGSKMLNKDQIEEAAFKQVRTGGRSELAPLHVSHSNLKRNVNYRVDVKKISLVESTEKQVNRKKRKQVNRKKRIK
jgi:hypothetical protein